MKVSDIPCIKCGTKTLATSTEIKPIFNNKVKAYCRICGTVHKIIRDNTYPSLRVYVEGEPFKAYYGRLQINSS